MNLAPHKIILEFSYGEVMHITPTHIENSKEQFQV